MNLWCSQYLLLIQKNLKVKWASKVGTILEVLLPLLVIGVLIGFLQITASSETSKVDRPVLPIQTYLGKDQVILFSPNTTDVTAIMTLGFGKENILGLENGTAMTEYYSTHYDDTFAGVAFLNQTNVSGATILSYGIRFDADFQPSSSIFGDGAKSTNTLLNSGFLSIQVAIDRAILAINGLNTVEEVQVRQFAARPLENWEKYISSRSLLKIMGPMFIIVALFSSVFRYLAQSVTEKEERILELMRMMGLLPGAEQCAWFTTVLIMTVIPCIIFPIILHSIGVYHFCPTWVYLLFVFSELFSLFALGSLTSLFVNKAKFAGILGFAVAVAFCAIGIYVMGLDTSPGMKLVVSLLSPAAFAVGHYMILELEVMEVSLGGSNIIDSSLVEGYPAFLSIIGMMYLDIVLYLILAWYIGEIFPGEYGLAKSKLFFLHSSYWSSLLHRDDDALTFTPTFAQEDPTSNADVEIVSENLKSKGSVQICGLSKSFDGDKSYAVDELNVAMFEGQITAFLGHNGAGKTTTISMLCGLIPPSGGDAFLLGYSIQNQMHKVRKTLGVCPQHDVIWPTMTVRDHLYLYAGLKGVPFRQLYVTVDNMINQAGLQEKRDYKAGALSGGQKRKLCLAIAFIGGSKVVFLDEPTSGMDPITRRSVWDFLVANKEDRVIVLTTHFMDEADFLGDRIAILTHGKLRCAGTSLFLKSRLGVGYLITFVTTPECVPDRLTDFVSTRVPNANLLSSFGGELAYRLPKESVSVFGTFLEDLDGAKEALGVKNYGISLTTLEEVFLRIGLEDKVERDEELEQRSSKAYKTEFSGEVTTESQGHSFKQQLRALLVKCIQVYKTDVKGLVFTLALPILLIIASAVLIRVQGVYISPGNTYTPTPRLLSPDMFGNSTILYSGDNVGILPSSPYYDPNRFVDVGASTPDQFDKYVLNYTGISYGGFMLNNLLLASPFTNFTVEFNSSVQHSVGTNINLINDAILRNITAGSVGLNAYFMPFPHVLNKVEAILATYNMLGATLYGIIMLAAFCLIPAALAGPLVQESASRVKQQILVSGAKKEAYWLSNYIRDLSIFLILILVAIIAILADSTNFEREAAAGLLIIMILYALCIIPLTYLLCLRFSNPSTIIGVIFGIHFGAGIALNMAFTSFTFRGLANTTTTWKLILNVSYYLFCAISPQFCIIYSFQRVLGYLSIHPRDDRSWFSMNLLAFPIIVLFVHAIVWSLVLYFVECVAKDRKKFFNNDLEATESTRLLINTEKNVDIVRNEDEDVAAERKRVLYSKKDRSELVRVLAFRKEYPGPNKSTKVAVRNLTLGIPKGQCFGLLGMNGAGKSTTLSALCGEIEPTCGAIFLNGVDLLAEPGRALQYFGWCPQFDALVGNLTGRQQLTLYAHIKGLKESEINSTVTAFLKLLDLEYLADRMVMGYSGGNKRKLSLAIAMIGNPPIVFCDEPSTGMDPLSRRFMWNVIKSLATDKVVVITTHSMEECEALANRIGIMAEGKLVCLGSSQHLKHRFAEGYSMQIKTTAQQGAVALSQISAAFPKAELVDNKNDLQVYEIPQESGYRLSTIFAELQRMGQEGILVDYSISQSTLEQVFLKLANP